MSVNQARLPWRSAHTPEKPCHELSALGILLLLKCQIVYLGVRRLEKNNSILLPEFHCMPGSQPYTSLSGIISEFQKYLKKTQSPKIP